MPKSTKNDVLIVGVLDQSGSMSGFEKQVVDGFNSLISDQLEQKGNTYVSLVLFDSTATVRYVAQDAKYLPQLGTPENPYRPAGMTALYDAVGAAIQGTERWLALNPFKGKVIVVVWTDGGENSSKEFGVGRSYVGQRQPWINRPVGDWGLQPYEPVAVQSGIDRLNAMIDAKKELGWVFQFMGSGESAWLAGKAFTAIKHTTFLHNTADSYTRGYGDFSNSISASRMGAAYAAVPSDAGAGA